MKKYLMALALALLPLLAGCLAMSLSTPLRGGTICLTPEFDAGGYSTKTVVSKYTQASINHLQLDLYSGVTLIASKDILNAALGTTVTINNLKSDTTYTIKASAYKAAGVAAADLISIPADSQVEVTVAFDDHPTLASIPVKLIGTPFGATATGSVVVTPSANFTTPATESFPFIISTFAGNGTEAYGGDNGEATSAKLNSPGGVAFDSAGNLYIADCDNNRIRKVTTSGIITTVAGTGASGYNSDGVAATDAKLCYPFSVACDSAGNLYIADTYNHRIRKVDKDTQIITTVAGTGTAGYNVAEDGGAATDAKLNRPYAVTCDSVGNLYIADTVNNRIRKVDKDTQIISTVAGTTGGFSGDGGAATSAKFDEPNAVAFDSAGNLYIADTENNRIRKVDKDTQIITTVAGDGAEAYGGDGLVATAAKLDAPRTVAFDSAGNLYIADCDNSRIRKVDKDTQIISTIAGDGTVAYGGDGGVATSAKLSWPDGLAFDSACNLYIADCDNQRIRKVCF